MRATANLSRSVLGLLQARALDGKSGAVARLHGSRSRAPQLDNGRQVHGLRGCKAEGLAMNGMNTILYKTTIVLLDRLAVTAEGLEQMGQVELADDLRKQIDEIMNDHEQVEKRFAALVQLGMTGDVP